ncbi:LLM class flavin-dependent oxidoreductase (plasmid) [Rhodococcoides fascians A21d2]|uniref:LLM class flavin-dependent oxidoreductase n=1 Tax=Rhodococcoides fascians TaxID=1828 RepID=UPI0005623B7E|nr:LLM class flavin-dependent oxidoreductase [Rhodococcus fascians]QII03700.1 LLM class flavin-dependent oxidoreductase [Rhodococcus fascians A21d2]
MHLAVALTGTGWHPASWRDTAARPEKIIDITYWTEIVQLAEAGGIDFVTLEDGLALQSSTLHRADDRTDELRGQLDAVLTVAALAPRTSEIGLIPTVNVTHSEPFHVSSQIASLDWASNGRAGLRPQITFRADDARNVGRRATPQLTDDDITDPVKISTRLTDLFDDAAHYLGSVRDLWDSWNDDAVVRDASTFRYIDRDRLHRLTPDTNRFRPLGPSITPRSPQGQPIVVALGHAPIPYRLAAREADIVFITPRTDVDVVDTVREVRAIEALDRPSRYLPLAIYVDLTVLLADDTVSAAERRAALDANHPGTWTSDSRIFSGTAEELADIMVAWQSFGIDGFRLRPAVLPTDLTRITTALVPILQDRCHRPTVTPPGTLRSRLGLAVPESRFRRSVSAR